MRILRPALMLSSAAALSCCTSQGTSPWDALNEQTTAAYRAGDDGACIESGKKAVALAEGETDPKSDHLVHSLNAVAACALNKGDPTLAREMFERARTVAEKAGSNLEPNYLSTIYNNLAALAWSEGRANDAEALQKANLARVEKTLGPDSEDLAMIKSGLGSLYAELGRFDEGQRLIEDALAICRRGQDGHGCSRTLPIQDAAGRFYTKQGNFAKAETLLAHSLAYEVKEPRADASRVQTLEAIGDLAVAKGDDARAREMYGRALDLAAKSYPEPHLMATIEGNLAAVHARQGRDAEAEPLYRNAIAVEEKAVGMDAKELVKTLEGLAVVCERTGKADEAGALRQRAAVMGPRIH